MPSPMDHIIAMGLFRYLKAQITRKLKDWTKRLGQEMGQTFVSQLRFSVQAGKPVTQHLSIMLGSLPDYGDGSQRYVLGGQTFDHRDGLDFRGVITRPKEVDDPEDDLRNSVEYVVTSLAIRNLENAGWELAGMMSVDEEAGVTLMFKRTVLSAEKRRSCPGIDKIRAALAAEGGE